MGGVCHLDSGEGGVVTDEINPIKKDHLARQHRRVGRSGTRNRQNQTLYLLLLGVIEKGSRLQVSVQLYSPVEGLEKSGKNTPVGQGKAEIEVKLG